jgi:signal transducer and activator of transcription 5B
MPFQVTDKVRWPLLAEALNTRFMSQCSLGLSHDNLQYLATKLYNTNNTNEDFTNHFVSWSQFNRVRLHHLLYPNNKMLFL